MSVKLNKKLPLFTAAVLGATLSATAILGGVGSIAAYAQPENNTIATTYQSQSALVNEPTVVTEVSSAIHFTEICAADEKPSNVIFYYENSENLNNSSGSFICTLSDAITDLSGKALPILRIESQSAVYDFVGYMNSTQKILDIAVASSDPEIIKEIKSDAECQHVRGILYAEETDDLFEIIKTANVNLASTVVIPQQMASIENVRYIQGRFKTVWVNVDDTSGLNMQNAINSGAYGLIVEDYAMAYDVLEGYDAGYTRTPFNVAHRGLPSSYNENSISGTQAAIQNGATHVELDVFLSSDNQIFLMHDSTLDRTTNGTGDPSKMTLAQIQQYKLDLFGEEKIPTIDDVFEVIKQSNVVLVLELKTSDTNIVAPLREKIEEYDMWDKMVVITFYLPQLEKMYELIPEIPTANLNTAQKSNFAEVLVWMGQYNAGVDTGKAYGTVEFNEQYLRDRGIIGWYWTYDDFATGVTSSSGNVGLTNNGADTALGKAMYANAYVGELSEVQVGSTVTLNVVTYGGSKEVEGTVIAAEQTEAGYDFICKYEDNGMILYTQVLSITNKTGCSGSVSSAIFALTALGAALVVVNKKRK